MAMTTWRGRALAATAGLALAAVLVVLAVAMRSGVGATATGRADTGGQPMPAFALERFDGGAFDSADHADGPLFVYFWASWCIPCEEEAPVIQRVWPEYRDRGYTFLGVNIWDAESDARRFIERHGLSFPLAPDAERSMYVDYGVASLPSAYFLEPGMRAHARYDGPLDEDTLRGLLDEIAPGGTP
ncbi:MAG: TlpA disulfide reductase family protein [Dehalococcoidia bacterium]